MPLIEAYTVTVCEQLAELPQASVAVQTIVVTPAVKGSASGLLSDRTPTTLIWLVELHVSETEGDPGSTVVEHCPAVSCAVLFAGQVIVGGVVSTVVIVWVHVDLFPQSSV